MLKTDLIDFCCSYPKAPVPVVIIKTGICKLLLKESRISWRCVGFVLPSIRSNSIPASVKCLAIRSSVRVQHENTILCDSQPPLAKIACPALAIPFSMVQVPQYIPQECLHLRRLSSQSGAARLQLL